MQLPDSEIEKIKKRYNNLVDENLDFDLKIDQARRILDVIFNHLKKKPGIKQEFNREMKAQRKRFAEKTKKKSYSPYEDRIENTFNGWLSFFIRKKYIPKYLKHSFSSIHKEVSESIHEKDVTEQIFPSTVARLNEIIRWLFKENKKPADFLKGVRVIDESRKEVEPSKNIDTKQKVKSKPEGVNKWKYATISSLLLVGAFALFYFLKFYTPETESGKTNTKQEPQKEQIDSTKKESIDKSKTNFTGKNDPPKKQDSNTDNKKLVSKPSTPKSKEVKTKESFDNNYALVKSQTDSEELDPALLNKLIEKYKDTYQFITDNRTSTSNRFEFKANVKATYKESQYTEGIISCNLSFSYQIIDNSNNSIVKNHSSQASGIGHSNSLAKQNAIQKLKI